MEFYTNVKRFGNNLFVRGYRDNAPFADKIHFEPKLYITSKDGDWKSFGENKTLKEMSFSDMVAAKNFIQKYDGVEGLGVFGNKNYEVQYISDKWSSEVKYNFSRIRIAYLDIETRTEFGFPKYENPVEEISLITVNDTTFSVLAYDDIDRKSIDIRLFKDEAKMLEEFLLWWQTQNFDIITGWNVEGFDIPYMYSRIHKVLGEDWLKLLSPWNKTSAKMSHDEFGNDFLKVDIAGISQLDYLLMYKKFTYTKQESYTLDFICESELGENKLENPYNTFKEFYTQSPTIFTKYNRRDVSLVRNLEKKMKLLELIVSVAYIAKVNYETVFSPVATWDAIIYNYLKDRKIATPLEGGGKKFGRTEGAYVEDPIVGKRYKWLVSIDATSLYPSIMQAWNLSPEMFVGVRDDVDVNSMMNQTVQDIDSRYTLSANGALHKKDSEGVFGQLITYFMSMRKTAKNDMLEGKKKREAGDSSKDLDEYISAKNNMQMAVKILMNSLYGSVSNQYFRYFNVEIARAITLNGQYIIKQVKRELNKMLNELLGTKDFSYVIYLDTDSCYIHLEPYVDMKLKQYSEEEIIEKLSKFCDRVIQPIVDKITDDLQSYSNVYRNTISFKQEATASSGFWRGKKNYAMKVHRSEGVIYDEPDIKIMGMEAVKSSTPKMIRDKLKDLIKTILTHDVESVRIDVENFRKEFKNLSIYEIAKPTSCNGLGEYANGNSIYKKGTPMHVRGALLYNHYIKQFGADNQFPAIKEGEKVRQVYLKMPNKLKENVVCFIDKIPVEFGVEKMVDYDLQFEKAYLGPVISMCEAVGWSLEEINTLEEFFG